MHRQQPANRRIGAPQFFADQRERDGVHRRATILPRNRAAEEAKLRHATDEMHRERARLVGCAGERSHLVIGEVAGEGLNPLLLWRKLEVHQTCSSAPSTANPSISIIASGWKSPATSKSAIAG